MIFRGRKVLDGTLEGIQEEFMTNIMRVRLADPHAELPRLPGVEVTREGQFWELRCSEELATNRVLKEIAASSVPIEHFEQVRPTLHDIFVRVARPEEDEAFSQQA